MMSLRLLFCLAATADALIVRQKTADSSWSLANLKRGVQSVFGTEEPAPAKRAFITMFIKGNSTLQAEEECPGCKPILDLAEGLRNANSAYPLVVITNVQSMLEKGGVTSNIIFRPLAEEDMLQHKCKMADKNKDHFQKLMIFGMTEYEKLIWLDVDVHVKANVDHLFEGGDKKLITAQWDDFDCDAKKLGHAHLTSHEFCSGVMRFKPSKTHMAGLMKHSSTMKECWGDQILIADYFHKVQCGKKDDDQCKLDFFDEKDVVFGKCSRTKHGRKIQPNLVHESGELRGWVDGADPSDKRTSQDKDKEYAKNKGKKAKRIS